MLVLAYIEFNPQASTREITRECDTSQNSIRILKSQNFHAYHFSIGHILHPGDEIQQMRFCQFFLRRAENDPNFPRKIFLEKWVDEYTFTNNGMFNKHNEHTWATKNSRL